MSSAVETEWSIIKTVVGFTACFDEHDLDGMVALFAHDGRWLRLDGEVQGHEGLRQLMRGRAASTFARHVLSNHRIVDVSADAARCLSYVTVYRLDGVADQPLPHDFDGAAMLFGQCEDWLVREEATWRLQKRQVQPALIRRSASH